MNNLIQAQLDLLPNRTGIYKFYDDTETLLYIGKALNLRSRVNSYFRDTHADRPHIISMIPRIIKIEYIETDGEVEALVLESALIKQNLPPYNVELRDDKSYAYIYLSTHDQFPTVKVVRSIRKNEYKKGRLFGPYPSGRAVRQVFRYIRKLYPFCTCKAPKEPCLYVHMGQCPGPYFGSITKQEYMDNIGEIIKFLDGRKKRHVSEIERKMKEYAANEQFERAALLRDQIDDLKHLGNRISFSYQNTEEEFVKKRENVLKTELVSLAEDLGLEKIDRIECYDISNIQGTNAYGSMVVAIDGVNRSSEYRAFRIKEKDTPDDYEMLRETLRRRVAHIGLDNTGDASLNSKPDIIMIDGGKGQLSAVRDIIPPGIFLLGISKGRSRKKKGLRLLDQFWILNDESSELVRVRTPRILSNLRDEAHRFALKHHRKARGFYRKRSILDSVKGIGPKKKKALIQKFSSVGEMRNRPVEELNEILKNQKIAEALFEELNKTSEKSIQS